MKIVKIWLLTLILLNSIHSQLFASDSLNGNRPLNVDDSLWNSLKQSINQTKFLPQPAGIGGNNIGVGRSVSIDGNRALVGAYKMDTSGYVYVLEFDGVNWTKTATIKPNVDDEEQANFGYSVSLSGNRALIGANNTTGSAYIFDYDGTNWIETQQLVASDRNGFGWFGFGRSVSLSGDRAVVGAEWDSISDLLGSSGSAYVFDFDGNTWNETQKIIADDADRSDRFANVVDFSGDTIFIGASNADGSFNRGGAVYVFDFNGTSWSQTHKLEGSSDANSSSFGNTLSISGNKAIIGTNKEYSYIFEFDGTNWNETHQFSSTNGDYDYINIKSVSLDANQILVSGLNSNLTISEVSVFAYDGANWSKKQQISSEDITEKYSFGSSVSLSGDNLIIGAANAVDVNANNSGAAFVYGDNGANWENEFRYSITEDGSAAALFGYSVSLFDNRALVGAYGENDLGSQSGSAYIYEFDGTVWAEMQKLHASDGAKLDYFAYSLSLLGDRAIIGAYGDDDKGELSGSVYIFDFDGSQWNQSQKLTASDGTEYDYFGKSVSLSENRILIGAERNDNPQGRGAAYIFDLVGGTWSETQKITALDSDALGNSVHLLGDRAVIADARDDDMGFNAGAAYIFEFDGTSWGQTQKLLATDGEGREEFGASVHMSNSTVAVGARYDDDIDNRSGSAYVFDYDGTNWTQTQKLIASDGGENHRFGGSVQILGNTILIGSSRDDNFSTLSGSAYIFKNHGSGWNQTQKLTPIDGSELDYFGGSVSLGLNKVLIGSSQDNDYGNDSGSAYLIDIDLIYRDGFE